MPRQFVSVLCGLIYLDPLCIRGVKNKFGMVFIYFLKKITKTIKFHIIYLKCYNKVVTEVANKIY